MSKADAKKNLHNMEKNYEKKLERKRVQTEKNRKGLEITDMIFFPIAVGILENIGPTKKHVAYH